MPGFCGDLLGGSYVPFEVSVGQHEKLLKEGIVNYILRKNFCLLKDKVFGKVAPALADRISADTSAFDTRTIEGFCSIVTPPGESQVSSIKPITERQRSRLHLSGVKSPSSERSEVAFI